MSGLLGPNTHVLTVKDPWYSHIVNGEKDIELRGRNHPDICGCLLHCAKVSAADYYHIIHNTYPLWKYKKVGRNGYIGHVILFGETITYSTEGQFLLDKDRHLCNWNAFHPGIKGWVIKEVFKADPATPFRGMPGFPMFEGTVDIESLKLAPAAVF